MTQFATSSHWRMCAVRLVAVMLSLLAISTAWSTQLVVTALTVQGQPVNQAEIFFHPAVGAARAISARIGDRLPTGTQIRVPIGTTLELESSHGNRLLLHGGARFVAAAIASNGEAHVSLAGRIEFLVRIVNDDRLQSEQNSDFSAIEALRLGDIKSYPLDAESYLFEFQNYAAAEAYFRNAYQIAQASGDRSQLARATLNLMSIYHRMGRDQAALELEPPCRTVAALALRSSINSAQCRCSIAFFQARTIVILCRPWPTMPPTSPAVVMAIWRQPYRHALKPRLSHPLLAIAEPPCDTASDCERCRN